METFNKVPKIEGPSLQMSKEQQEGDPVSNTNAVDIKAEPADRNLQTTILPYLMETFNKVPKIEGPSLQMSREQQEGDPASDSNAVNIKVEPADGDLETTILPYLMETFNKVPKIEGPSLQVSREQQEGDPASDTNAVDIKVEPANGVLETTILPYLMEIFNKVPKIEGPSLQMSREQEEGDPASDTNAVDIKVEPADGDLEGMLQSKEGEMCDAEELQDPFFVAVKEEPEYESTSEEDFMKEHLETTAFTEKLIGEDVHLMGFPSMGIASASGDHKRQSSRKKPPKQGKSKKSLHCDTCGKYFTHRFTFDNHLRIHTGEKPFLCSVCGRSFCERRQLVVHTRTHTGEKPFTCSICRKAFGTKGNLGEHTRVHTGEKPYKCGYCGKDFSARNTLLRHIRIHTGEKPHSCTVCQRRFSRLAHLKAHKCIPHGVKSKAS